MLFRSDSVPNALFALQMSVRRFFRGPVFVSKDVQAVRRAACHGCHYNLRGQCYICTCFVELKTSLAAEKCPLAKWGREDGKYHWRRRIEGALNRIVKKFLNG